MLTTLAAHQLGHPSGLVGRRVLVQTWNRRNRALNDTALQTLALQPHDRVMEVGFGGGYLLGLMAARVTTGFIAGIDASETMASYCGQHYRPLIQAGRMRLYCAAAEAAPFAPALFDKACTVNSIFYWSDAARALRELSRLLKQGGVLVLCFTCRESLQDKGFARQGLHLYDIGEVQAMLIAADFARIAVERLSDRHREFWCVSATRSSG